MKSLRFLVWVIGPVVLLLGYLTFGLPHIAWSYSWRDEGQGYDPFAERYYTRCSYIGPHGNFTIHNPHGGKCSWFIFRKSAQAESR